MDGKRSCRMEGYVKVLSRMIVCACLVLAGVSGVALAGQTQPGRGKFYIVGMGTAPDLITIRAAEVVRSADIIMVENEQQRDLWKDRIGNKEVWFCPQSILRWYGLDPETIKDPQQRALVEKGVTTRRAVVDRIRSAVEQGRIVASLQGGDPMMYGLTMFLEMLPSGLPSEIVPGVGAFQAATAAVKMSPSYGYDTNGVILTAADWAGRADPNEKLMATGSSMVFYTMRFDYPAVFAQLQRLYPADTPVAVVNYAGDLANQRVIRSTVGRFLQDVDYKALPDEQHTLLIGKFLTAGQARKEPVSQIGEGHKP
jgi:precorrin-4/cobalt-precorrin-4 C11-methyltransferase